MLFGLKCLKCSVQNIIKHIERCYTQTDCVKRTQGTNSLILHSVVSHFVWI